MNVQALSPKPKVRRMNASFIADTDAKVSQMRAEEVLGVPVIDDRMWTSVVKISPEQAKRLLLSMPTQRLLQKSNVDYFIGMMRSGRFRTTHQGMAFNRAGRLIDGMHRLTACVEADAEIEVQATFGMPDTAFDCFDRGKVRSAADDLVVRGVATSRQESLILAAAIKILHNYARGQLPWASLTKDQVAQIDAEEIILRHERLLPTVSYIVTNCRFFTGMSLAGVAAFTTMFREVNAEKADKFIEQVMRGENLSAGSPALALRDFIRFTGSAKREVIRSASMIVFVRCWNAFVEGRSLLRVNSALSNGQFPKISTGK